jgi:3-oxoacyl-[acyl-carrier protein] reductase
MLLKGKNAVITGASRGIGRAAVELFAKNGANVWACVRSENKDMADYCEKLREKFSVAVKTVPLDFLAAESVKNAAREIKADKADIDILVNNAGVVPENRLFQMASSAEMARVFQVNFFATLEFTKLLSKSMIRNKKGSIVNVVSIAALDGEPAQLEYVASKAALAGATKKLASELGNYGIRVNGIAPGITNTAMIDEMAAELKERYIARTALKKIAEPEDIAKGILFFASDLSSHVTGQILRVDGGLI